QSLHAWASHIPGLKVAVPATPYDAKGLLKSAIRDDNPVVFFEDKMMYQLKGAVPAEEYTIPLGVAEVKRAGRDITLIATSSMVQVALAAADLLASDDIDAEVVDEGYERYGATAEIASVVADGAFYYLGAPVKRLGAMDVPGPFSPVLEEQTVPTPEKVAEMAQRLCSGR